jgi:hypothetical protein
MIKLVDLLKEVVGKVKCKNCGWSWNLSDGGKDPYVCHKCKYDNKNNKFVKAIKEMADTDDDFSMIMYVYKNGSEQQKSIISSALALGPKSKEDIVSKALTEADKEDVEYIKEQLGIPGLKLDVNIPEELKQLIDKLAIKQDSVQEKKNKGLYYYINKNQEQGKKPARKGSEAFKKAYSAMQKINKNK